MRLLVVLGLLFVPAIAEARDPFAPFEKPSAETDLPPIQRVPVDALKLAGVVTVASPRALVRLPDGSEVEVRVGDVAGNNLGVVKSIGKDRIVVVERCRDALGVTTTKHVLSLR
jgi:Tfp pilus assembly protein PilP